MKYGLCEYIFIEYQIIIDKSIISINFSIFNINILSVQKIHI